ncbi:hypothetical protein [Sphingomicrobium nitratireducens]|uniref:hypothetical protein n=1 Tax=Sphingomicrobium nitratireducens TaxID=2964666 RepID=UPI00223FE76F|nr:hypothetical protein [Sphingomicrobium nitratireducens]
MTKFKTFQKVLMMGVAAGALSACGADDVASPGDGVIVVPAPAPAPAPTPSPTPTPTPGEAAASCPTGTANVGTIEVGGAGSGDNRRVCQVSGTIRGSLTLENLAGTIYSLNGKVEVGDDLGPDAGSPLAGTAGTLTIEEGVTIFASAVQDFLVVNRGSQIFVDGAADAPVVFTARKNVLGTVGESEVGLWGGIVVLGRAPIGDCDLPTTPCQAQVEGSDDIYGGTSASDNSGRLEYLQVRYAGYEVLTDNELNGITLGGVGDGTVVDHVQVHNNLDDGMEWFGGTVNNYHLVMTGNGDEMLDYDSGYDGATQFVIGIQYAGRGDKIIEVDSDDKPRDATPRTNVEISNATFYTPLDEYMHIRGEADIAIYNTVINAVNDKACFNINEDNTAGANGGAPDELGEPRFKSVVLDCGTDPIRDDGDVSVATIQALFAGNNNNLTFTSTLTDMFINGDNETAVTFSSTADLENADAFTDVTYIGAVPQDGSNNWYDGWTCGLVGQASCLEIPAAG